MIASSQIVRATISRTAIVPADANAGEDGAEGVSWPEGPGWLASGGGGPAESDWPVFSSALTARCAARRSVHHSQAALVMKVATAAGPIGVATRATNAG